MNCADIEPLIALQAGGDLSTRESTELEGHLAQCAACQELAAEMMSDLDWLRGAHLEPADRSALLQVRESVMGQLEAKRGRWAGPWLPIPWKWQIVAVSVVAVMLGGVAWWRAAPVVEEPRVAEKKEAHPDKLPAAVLETKPAPAEKKILATRTKPRAAKPVQRRKVEPAPMELVRVDLEPKSEETSTQAVMIKIPTSNPDIVVYMLMDDSKGGDGS